MEHNANYDNRPEEQSLSEVLEVINMDTQVTERVESNAPSRVLPPQHRHLLTPSASLPVMQVSQEFALSLSNEPSTSNAHRSNVGRPGFKIIEQPAASSIRFRYPCEGRSAGSILGANSTSEHKTYPTVEFRGCTGEVIVVVSCVSKDAPYYPHPHNLVGKDTGDIKYKNGVCQVKLKGQDPIRISFPNMGIQCVKRREIQNSLDVRVKTLNIDPFKAHEAAVKKKINYELNAVRLCFQPYIKSTNGIEKLPPEVSEPIFDKKTNGDLKICKLCRCAAKVTGGDRIILLCEKVKPNDVRVRFYEKDSDGDTVWVAYGTFSPSDVHKAVAIDFVTPPYRTTEIEDTATVFIQLERQTDFACSEPLPFDYYPDPGMRTFNRIRRKLKRKEDIDIFSAILSLDSEITATKYSCPPTDLENDDIDIDETVSSDSSASKNQSSGTLNEDVAAIRRRFQSRVGGVNANGDGAGAGDDSRDDEDDIEEYEDDKERDMEIELEVPQINFPIADESTQTSTPMEEILKQPQLSEIRPLSAADKITEWMRSSEFERTDSLIVENGDAISTSPITVINANNLTSVSTNTDEDKTFTELMEQVAELDGMLANKESSRRGTLDNPILKELPNGSQTTDAMPSASNQASVELDENFDETTTYTSLQIAYKNPVDIPGNVSGVNKSSRKVSQSSAASTTATIEDEVGLVVLTNPPAPKIKVNIAQTPPSPPSPPPAVPPRTPSPVSDQKVPPLPPKRKCSQELSSNESTPSGSMDRTRNGSLSSRPPSQIIIMRTPDQSPTKRFGASTPPVPSPKKKQGFFSRIFSRNKCPKSPSKNQLSASPAKSEKSSSSRATTPNGSREPSIGHFSLADPNRSSVRSAKSLQGNSMGLSPHGSSRGSKPVGRSASSVSGKRPAHLSADVIHIPLKGEGLPDLHTVKTFGEQLDRKTLSALQLADIPVCDGNLELVAIADRQSIKNLCEGDFGVILDPGVDLDEAEHFALYTSAPPSHTAQALLGAASEVEEKISTNSNSQIITGPVLSADEIALRLAQANGLET